MVPKAIASALTFTYVVGWLFNVVLVFCMGDPAAILASDIEQPVVQIFYNVMGKGPAIFFAVAAFLIMNFVCITALQAGSRTIWAFSRDSMLPGSTIWYKIWKPTSTPVLAVWLYATLCVLINLIGLGSYITISAIFNTCAIALDWSYCIPILCKLYGGRFEKGPWNLGRASTYLNLWACCWTAFVSVIFFFPTTRPVTADNVSPNPSIPPLPGHGAHGRRIPAILTRRTVSDELRRRHPDPRLRPGARLLAHPRQDVLHGAPVARPRRDRRDDRQRRQRHGARPGEAGERTPRSPVERVYRQQASLGRVPVSMDGRQDGFHTHKTTLMSGDFSA